MNYLEGIYLKNKTIKILLHDKIYEKIFLNKDFFEYFCFFPKYLSLTSFFFYFFFFGHSFME